MPPERRPVDPADPLRPVDPGNQGRGRQRRMQFRAGPSRDADRLVSRLMASGIDVDRLPAGDGSTVVRATALAERFPQSSLAKDMAKGLGSVQVESDETDDA